MGKISRRKLITTGLAATAGASGIAAAASLARRYGLIPPDGAGIYGPGETLTYAAQRLLTRSAMAREFPRSEISPLPFANEVERLSDEFKRLQDEKFAGWKIAINGMVSRPGFLSLAEIKAFPRSSQITLIACEEGWSYVAEWIGAPLSHVLNMVGILPQARYVVYRSIQSDWWDSIDLADAFHPQTLMTYGMNGKDLPVAFGGPLRMRVPRQLGYKNVKYITSLTMTDDLKQFGKGLGSASPEGGYSWYAGM
jgi:DMSO/TMAO reductase YedYZ molybdopterin-dependent catalytic subunit